MHRYFLLKHIIKQTYKNKFIIVDSLPSKRELMNKLKLVFGAIRPTTQDTEELWAGA